MSTETIRGFSIPIEGNTKELRQSLKTVNEDIKNISQQTNALKQSLKTNWTMESFTRAQQTASEAVAATEKKVQEVKTALADLANSNVENAAQKIQVLTVELIKSEDAAFKAKKSLATIVGSEFNNNLQKANTEIDLTKRKLDTLSTGLSIKWDKSTFVQAQAAARESVEKTHDKLKVLETELRRLENDSSTDRTSAEFKELETQIGEVKLEAIQAEQKLSSINQIKFDKVTGILDKLGSSMMRSGAVLTAGVTLPLAYVGKQALETASDLQEVQNVVDVSFKESSKSIDSWSKSLLYSNGISELTAKQNAGLYKSMANGMGVADEAGTEMSQTLTELIGDVASFKNLSFDVVGTKLKSVFTGETESLKDIGVVMTEANVNAYALANGMEQLSSDMSQAEKVNLRYKFVVDSLKDAQGDFARTIDSTANQTKLAQEQFKSLSIELAEELLPIATDILKWANETMKAFSGMSDSAKTTTLIIIGLAAGIGPAVTVIGALSKVVSVTAAAITSLTVANTAAAVSTTGFVSAAATATSAAAFLSAAVVALTVGVTMYAIENDEATKSQKALAQAFEESTDSYSEYTRTIDDNADSQNAEIELASKLIDRYSQLNGNVKNNSVEKAVLQNTIKELNELLGIEFTLIDEEIFKYDQTAESIRRVTQARKDEILQIATRNKAIKAQETMLDLQEQKKKALDNIKTAKNEKGDGSLLTQIEIALGIDEVREATELYKDIVDQERELQSQLDAYTKMAGDSEKAGASYELTNNQRKSSYPQQNSGLTAEQKTRNDKLMQEEKQALDARMDLGMYSEQVYYDKLKEIRSKYYGDRQKDAIDMTDIEHSLNKEIHTQEVVFQKQREASAKASNSQIEADTKKHSTEQTKAYKEMYDKQKKLSKDAYDENKKLLKSSYDETKKKLDADYKDEISRIDNALKHKEDNINSAIKAIDKEIEARKRLKQSEEFDSQIDVLKGQLSYDKMDEFTKRELEAELKRLEDEKSDYAWELAQTDRKEELQQDLSDAQERASREKANLQEMLDINKTALEETYNLQFENLEAAYNLHSEQLESMFNSASVKMGEISNNFVRTISSGIVAAIGKLSGMVAKANEETSKIANVRNYSSNDYSQRKAEVNINGTNYTAGQLQRIAQREIDKILYQ